MFRDELDHFPSSIPRINQYRPRHDKEDAISFDWNCAIIVFLLVNWDKKKLCWLVCYDLYQASIIEEMKAH